MVLGSGTAVLIRLFDAVVRPSRLVETQRTAYVKSRAELFDRFLKLSWIYVVNILLYAVPLTLAGIGFTSTADPPQWFVTVSGGLVGNTETLWQLTVGTVQNSVFVTVATGVVLVSYHSSVVFTLNSRGFLRSFYTVIYSTSAYLITIFTSVMYLSTANGVTQARELVLGFQKGIFYVFIDAMGADLDLPGGRPGELVLSGLSSRGEFVIGLLIIAAGYFLYSLYLGARINHKVSRIEGIGIVVMILLTPIVYIVFTILYSAAVA